MDEPTHDQVTISRWTWAATVKTLRHGNAREQAAAADLLMRLAPGGWAADLGEPAPGSGLWRWHRGGQRWRA